MHTAGLPPPSTEPTHVLVPCTSCDTSLDLLSLAALLEAGWTFTWTPGGHYVDVPNVRRFALNTFPDSTLTYMCLVPLPDTGAGPQVTLWDAGNPAHAGITPLKFLLDTGADHSLIRPQHMHLLARRGSFPGAHCTGISGGPPLAIKGTGYLDFAFPGHAPASVPWGGRVVNAFNATSHPMRATIARAAAVGPRPASCAPIMSPQQIADRFNIFDHDALRAFHLTANGVSEVTTVPTRDYSNGIKDMANGRIAPTHSSLNAVSRGVREHKPPAHTWWTDISHMHEPDFNGDRYSRIFAEEATGAARIMFSRSKDTLSLLKHLEELDAWVITNVPGGRFMELSCDFGGEYAQQGHGDNIIVKALRAYCTAHPGFRVRPLAPHSQAYNKAENAIHQISGLAFANGCRARLGPTAWSILERGATFQHNHRAANHGMRCRMETLTERVWDASTMLGYVGQSGTTHDYTARQTHFATMQG